MVRSVDRSWLVRLGFCICVLAATWSQAHANEKRTTLADVFDQYDVDGSGVLEASECICQTSRRCDLNKDGSVSRREFSRAIAKHAGSHRKALKLIEQHGGVEAYYVLAKSGQLAEEQELTMQNVFAQWDRDKSGVLESGECVCQCSTSADVDGDGEVTSQEFTYLVRKHFGSEENFLARVRQQGGAHAFYNAVSTVASDASTFDRVFRCYDSNNSGSLEPGEWTCEKASQADSNRDGKITKEEMVVMVKQAFGSVDRFEQYVKKQGGPANFYAQRR